MNVNVNVVATKRQNQDSISQSSLDSFKRSESLNFGDLLSKKITDNRAASKPEVGSLPKDEVKPTFSSLQTRRMNKPEASVTQASNKTQNAAKNVEPTDGKTVSDSQATNETTDSNSKQAVVASDSNQTKAKTDTTTTETAVTETSKTGNAEDLQAVAVDVPVELNELVDLLPVLQAVFSTLSNQGSEVTSDQKGDVVKGLESLGDTANKLIKTLESLFTEGSIDLKDLKTVVNSDFKDLLKSLTQSIEAVLNGSSDAKVSLPKVTESLQKMQEVLKTNIEAIKNQSDVTQSSSNGSTVSNVTNPSDKSIEANAGKYNDSKDNGSNGNHGGTKQETFIAKVEQKIKGADITESSKVHNSQNIVSEFQAKLESASIAFGKIEQNSVTQKSGVQQLIMDQILNGSKMQVRTTENGTYMTMKLNPEVLGNVEVKLEIVKNVLQAEIKVENMIVKGAIESSLADLKNALSDKGYQVEQLNVSVGERQAGGQGQRQESSERSGWFVEDLEEQNHSESKTSDLKDSIINYLG